MYPTFDLIYLSRDMTKPTNWLRAQRRLRSAWASAASDQSSLCAQWVAKAPMLLHADNEDSDQTGRSSLGAHSFCCLLSCRSSFYFKVPPQAKKYVAIRIVWQVSWSQCMVADQQDIYLSHLGCAHVTFWNHSTKNMIWLYDLILLLFRIFNRTLLGWLSKGR